MTDVIADSIRDRILAADLPPGSRLNVDELRSTYGASHIPIREALQRLEAEGLVVRHPNKGTHVAGLDRGDAVDLLELRLLIEPTVARRALERRTDEDLSAASSALERLASTNA